MLTLDQKSALLFAATASLHMTKSGAAAFSLRDFERLLAEANLEIRALGAGPGAGAGPGPGPAAGPSPTPKGKISQRLINARLSECLAPGAHTFSAVFDKVMRDAAADPVLVEEIARRNFSRAWPGESLDGQNRNVQMAWCDNARVAIWNLIEKE